MNSEQYHRDSFYRLSVPLLTALFEPLTIPQRVQLEYFFNLINDKRFEQYLYRKCLALFWTEDTRQQLTRFYRKHTYRRRYESLEEWIEKAIVKDFVYFCQKMGPTLEHLTIADCSHIPSRVDRQNWQRISDTISMQWIIHCARLVELKITNVGGVDPRFRHLGTVTQRIDPLLLFLTRSQDFFRPIAQGSLEKLCIQTTSLNLEQYGLPRDTKQLCANRYCRSLRTLGTNPYLDWEEFTPNMAPYPQLEAYTVWIVDDPTQYGTQRVPLETLITRWRVWGERLMPPPAQIRRLRVVWYHEYRHTVIEEVFGRILPQFTNLISCDLTLSFVIPLFDSDIDSIRENFRKLYLRCCLRHTWRYRSLRLVFPSTTAHNTVDRIKRNETHLLETSLIASSFVGPNAVALKRLWLVVNHHLSPLVVDAPNIRLLHLDFRHWDEQFPVNFQPFFNGFTSAELIRELCLYNIIPYRYPNVPLDDEHEQMIQAYNGMLEHFLILFPAVEAVRLCCTTKLVRRGETDTFYLYFPTVIVKLVSQLFGHSGQLQRQPTESTFCGLHLVDRHHKPFDFILQLLEHFVIQARMNPTRRYLLEIAPCKVVFMPPRPLMIDQLGAVQQIYTESLEAAGDVPNLCLIIPDRVETFPSVGWFDSFVG